MPKPEEWKEWGNLKEKHMRNLGTSLNDMRKQNTFCDVIIHVGGKSFSAHKTVLAASCSYFMTMFTSGFKEGIIARRRTWVRFLSRQIPQFFLSAGWAGM